MTHHYYNQYRNVAYALVALSFVYVSAATSIAAQASDLITENANINYDNTADKALAWQAVQINQSDTQLLVKAAQQDRADTQSTTYLEGVSTEDVANDVSATAESFDDPFFGSDTHTRQSKPKVDDPLEPYNRFMFKVNNSVDKAVVKPAAKAYKAALPEPVRKSVGHFFGNLSEPWNATNLLLQGKPVSSLKSLGRFSINTLTTLGLADAAASEFGLTVPKEDFGQTLGVWGVPAGAYVVLPAFGPSTVRDVGGRIADSFGSPISYLDNAQTKTGLTVLSVTDTRAKLLALEGLVNTDDYELVRDVFLEKRAFDIVDSASPKSRKHDAGFDESFGD